MNRNNKMGQYLIAQIVFLGLIIIATPGFTQNTQHGKIRILTDRGHPIEMGASGFNVRIADKVWSYTHPDFREAVNTLRPGWLRYFSGTMGDAFSAATGQYNLDYAMMMDHQEQYYKGNKFVSVKGPHRIIDLYHLLGEVQGKLVVTINGFTETPEMTRALVQFCKDNNIIVDAWQFCNEPYFYVPNRNRYWWNDGYDYAQKMKPHADAIREVFPDAKMALNFTWDGIWDFMKEIHSYQENHGAYWNVFSKHSYAPHVGGKESFDQAMKRANSKIVEVTSKEAMEDIERFTFKGVPLLITEFGVWNRPLNGIFSAVYIAEYTLRQLAHPNAFLIGSHEISNKARPAKNLNNELLEAYEKGVTINTDQLRTGVELDDEGKALKILHQATNNSKYLYPTQIEGAVPVAGLNGESVESVFALMFEGVNGENYLAVTNRSGINYEFDLVDESSMDLEKHFEQCMIWSEKAENMDLPMESLNYKGNSIKVSPYSVNLIKWDNKRSVTPEPTRIYKSEITQEGVKLDWWKRKSANHYQVTITDAKGHERRVKSNKNQIEIQGLKQGETYSFSVRAVYGKQVSEASNQVQHTFDVPMAPEIFKISRRDSSMTVFWKSVPNTSGYSIELENIKESSVKNIDAGNVFGYRLSGLKYGVPYKVALKAYNGKGESSILKTETVILEKNRPIPPRNVSATETLEGHVYLNWVAQDTINENVKYNIYKGESPHELKLIKSNVDRNSFVDTSADNLDLSFYTVKSYNETGECDFYPNVATVIRRDTSYKLEIIEVFEADDDFLVKVETENLDLSSLDKLGVAIQDVSYLNLEETDYKASNIEGNTFTVRIPHSKLLKGRKYALKAYVKVKSRKMFSLPPFQSIKLN